MSTPHYLASLKAHLAGEQAQCDDLIEELRTHLEECAHDLQLQGLSVAESEREALRRFGPADDLAAAFAAGAPPTRVAPSRVVSFRARGAGLAALLALSLVGTVGGGMAAASLGAGHARTAVVQRSPQVQSTVPTRHSAAMTSARPSLAGDQSRKQRR